MEDLTQKYWRRAYLVAWFLQAMPYIRMIGVNGSLTVGNLKPTSDIDFLVITKFKRIWTCRFLVTIVTHLTGLRRYGCKIAGRICLNRYQTDHSLEILPHNEYHAKVFSTLLPILDTASIYQNYTKANQWMGDFNYPIQTISSNLVNNLFMESIRKMVETILDTPAGDWLENVLRTYQKRRILKDLRTKLAPEGRVRVSDEELCFHPLKDSSPAPVEDSGAGLDRNSDFMLF